MTRARKFKVRNVFLCLPWRWETGSTPDTLYQDGSRRAIGSISQKGSMAGAPLTLKKIKII